MDRLAILEQELEQARIAKDEVRARNRVMLGLGLRRGRGRAAWLEFEVARRARNIPDEHVPMLDTELKKLKTFSLCGFAYIDLLHVCLC